MSIDLLNDIFSQITKAPPLVIVMFISVLFGCVWKRMPWLPNKLLPIFTVGIPTAIYPAIEWNSAELAQKFFNPHLMAVAYGFISGCLCELGHEGIVSKLKKLGVQFPDDNKPTDKPADTTKP